jgi:hypothetical protein
MAPPAPALFLWLFLWAPVPPELDVYLGEYALIASESSDMKKVVDETAAALNFVVRPIARSRLRKTQVAFPTLRIARDSDGFRIRHEQGTDVAHRTLDDPVRTTAPDGSQIVVRLLPGPPMSQSYESGDGLRVNRYVMNGTKLTLEVRVTSPRLPKPIEYRLVYRRK